MIINSANLDTLRVGFSTAYQGAFDKVPTMRDTVSEVITSVTGENIYGWMGELSGMREWLGPRVVKNLEEHDYRIKNRDWEETIAVKSNSIADDTFGMYTKRFDLMGRSAARHPEKLVWDALKNGFTENCYDGQFFFDTDHPVLDENGDPAIVANTDGGAGAPWFLLATNEVIKPIIFQEREKAKFVAQDDPTDARVFNNKEFVYGSDCRCAVGYGFWQMAWGSKQTLDAAHYETARTAIYGMKGDHGTPMAMTPNLLVVPPSLEGKARKLLNSENAAGGETNEWKGTAELLVVPWLA